MKKLVIRTMALAAVLGLTCGFAQERKTMKADVPFAFRMGASVLPAGQYAVTQNPLTGLAVLASTESTARGSAVTSGIAPVNPNKVSRLVFHKYGNTYFLAEIWASTVWAGWMIPRSTAEREMARNAGPEIASVRLHE